MFELYIYINISKIKMYSYVNYKYWHIRVVTIIACKLFVFVNACFNDCAVRWYYVVIVSNFYLAPDVAPAPRAKKGWWRQPWENWEKRRESGWAGMCIFMFCINFVDNYWAMDILMCKFKCEYVKNVAIVDYISGPAPASPARIYC